MTDKYILKNGEIIDTSNNITFIDFEDVLILINGQSKKISELTSENKQLRQELRIYRKIASCHNCHYHNYDWNIDDGYGGEEFETCDKHNDVTEGICEEWREL